MKWRDAVIEAIHHYCERYDSRLLTRQGLIAEELAGIIGKTDAGGITPEQTLSRVLQELRDEGLLFFSSAGKYLLLDKPVDVHKEDVPEDALDEALKKGLLQLPDVDVGDSVAARRVRVGQDRIRELTLRYYSSRCGLCDVSDKRLLIAGHVSRWADDPGARGNLSNVICMCSFHDVLFENGYFSLADDYRVLRKPDVRSHMISQILDATEFLRADTPYPPSAAFLRKHRIRAGFAV